MNEYNLIIPSMGEGINEVTIIRWLKKEGDLIHEEDIIVEISTDKIDSEIISPVNGILKKIFFNTKEEVKIGETLAILEIKNKNISSTIINNTEKYNNYKFYSPLVKSIARKEGVENNELNKIIGSGIKGRLTKKDLLNYLNLKNDNKSLNNNYEIIKIDRFRNIISKNMIDSRIISAHVTSFVEADVTSIVLWRNKNKDIFKKLNGIKLSFMPIFVNSVIKAIKDFPMINISIDIKNNNIIKKNYINIGLAVSSNNNNLIVPVIKNADKYNLLELSIIINDLIKKARSNKLIPNEIVGGTYTITNIGSFGNILGTPIINQPQVAIMAMGLIQKKPSVIETNKGDFIKIRHKMYLSHSYDHRIIDGELGGKFAKRVSFYLENFDIRTII